MDLKLLWSAVLVGAIVTWIALIGAETADSAPRGAAALPANEALTPAVRAVLQRACVDCHSNATTWPWYSKIPPASWVMARHVSEGRQKLNFSEWTKRQRVSPNQMQEICDAVEGASMPPFSYTLLHRSASLSPDDIRILCDWPRKARLATSHRPSKAGRQQRNMSATGARLR